MSRLRLSGGGWALVDEADLPRLSRVSWHLHSSGYARQTTRVDGKQIRTYMHRLIAGAQTGDITDHINGNRLDNRRCNLRLVDASQSGANRRVASNNRSTGVLGVHCRAGRFTAYIRYRGVRRYLGSFDTLEDARGARLRAESEVFGEFAPSNRLVVA